MVTSVAIQAADRIRQRSQDERTLQRILIVNPFGIGDVLFTTPLIRALRQTFLNGYLGFLCNRRTELVLRNNPHLNEVFVYEKDDAVRLWRSSRRAWLNDVGGLLRRIRRSRFSLVVDLSLGERYGLILKLLGIPRRIGFDYRNRGRFLTERLPITGYQDVHIVDHYRKLLQFIGIRLVDDSLEMRLSAQDRQWADIWLGQRGLSDGRLLVGMVPAGGVSWGVDAPFRRWSSEGFASVADALVERYGAQIILFGETADTAFCKTVQRHMRHEAIDVSGQTSLTQFVALLGRLGLVICNDGGPLHLAVSQRVPTVSIFGPVDPRVYGPYPMTSSRHRVVLRHNLPCRPCYHQFRLPPCPYERACLMTIEPEEVVDACAQLLDPLTEQSAAGGLGVG